MGVVLARTNEISCLHAKPCPLTKNIKSSTGGVRISNGIAQYSIIIIADRVMRMHKQSGVHRILKVCKERVRVLSEYAFAKLCHK